MAEQSPAEAFFDAFLAPLLGAEEVTVGLPISRATWDILAADVTTRGDRPTSVELTLQMKAARLLPQPPIVSFDVPALRVAVALYQLLFSFHAAAEQGRVSEARLTRLVADVNRLLGDNPALVSAGQVIVNHLLVDPFFLLYRKDVEVFFRMGAKKFFGQDVEWVRLPFRWRVQHEETVGTDVATTMFDRETAAAFGALLYQSPLTRLVRADRLFDSFDFGGLGLVLGDQQLCRFAINSIIDRGIGAFMPAFAKGWQQLSDQAGRVRRAETLRVARFLVTLAMSREHWAPDARTTDLLDASYRPPTDAVRFEAPEVEAEAAQQGQTDRSLRDAAAREAWALVHVLLGPDFVERLEVPERDLALPATTRLRARLEAMAGTLGPAIDVMRDRTRRALG